ncbi:hypothetical protein ACVXG8_01100 [Escherichia coli]
MVFADSVDMMSARSRGGYARLPPQSWALQKASFAARWVRRCWRWNTGSLHRSRRTQCPERRRRSGRGA